MNEEERERRENAFKQMMEWASDLEGVSLESSLEPMIFRREDAVVLMIEGDPVESALDVFDIAGKIRDQIFYWITGEGKLTGGELRCGGNTGPIHLDKEWFGKKVKEWIAPEPDDEYMGEDGSAPL